jgi:AcrR family transcriptional regulator
VISGVEGLGEVSIGRLAKALRMSKSGLFVHFGSKEKLEMAVIERAYDIFNGRIFVPTGEKEISGIDRVWTLCDNWLRLGIPLTQVSPISSMRWWWKSIRVI